MVEIKARLLTQNLHSEENWVYLVTSDVEFGQKLIQQISHFGYRVQIVKDITKLEKAIASHSAVAVLIDISYPDGKGWDNRVSEKVREWQHISVPIIFISDRSDQPIRIQAIRAGGAAFFDKPVNIINLIDQLDKLQIPYERQQYRVLIVEAQATIATYHQLILQRVGITSEFLTDPMNMLSCMDEFKPNLILMDMDMPEISGLELIKMIRQIDAYVSIPIVFLSSKGDYSLQMQAMKLGGDDFLTKPLRADHLVETIIHRLERSRTLRSFMIRDSLTGLLNHTSFRERLGQEINRCARQGTKLALAMLDLDNFKTVNDTYGHAVGDTVLISVSRILQQRLRKTDIIGRYGGEEFVAILLDANGSDTFNVMDEIRSHFAKIQHFSPREGRFSAAFSCGIAFYPQFSNAPMLSDAADQAMYAAKSAGRNQVMIAE